MANVVKQTAGTSLATHAAMLELGFGWDIRMQLRIVALLLLGLTGFAQPTLTISHSPVLRYNDQYGPPTGTGINGCTGPNWNSSPCTGRWSYADTLARTWDGTTGWLTGNDGMGGQTTETTSGTFVNVMLGTMSSDNFDWNTSNQMDAFTVGHYDYYHGSGSYSAMACGTRDGVSTDGNWHTAGILAYHTKLYWWFHCTSASVGWKHANGTLLKSSDGFSTYTTKDHSTPVNVRDIAPAIEDIMFPGTVGIASPQWIQYAGCPDNYGCPYTRPHGGDSWAYMLCGMGGDNSFSIAIPCRVSWANLEADPFTPTNYYYLTYSGTQTTCANGDIDGNWSNDMPNILATSCHTSYVSAGSGGQADIFYSNELGVYVFTNWGTGTGDDGYAFLTLEVSPTPWGPWTTYNVRDVPAYGTKFTAADLRTYQASTVGGVTTVTVDVTTSGNNSGVDFTASSNYSIAKRTLTLSATTGTPLITGGGTTRPGRMRFPARIRVARVGTSNTQAILSYTAPNSDPCTAQVSESSGMTPLVHDVDTALFTGADTDNRTGSFSATTARVFVVGKRATELGLDSNYYSRALQANKTHYYSIACGGSVATGSFTTKNILLGNTYNEMPQHDPATGNPVIPTFPANRTTAVIDSQTGALAKRLWLSADSTGSDGAGLYSGGHMPMCGFQMVGPGPGWLCSFQTRQDYNTAPPPLIYYIIPRSDGDVEIRFLGKIWVPFSGTYPNGGNAPGGGHQFDPTDALTMYDMVDDTTGGKVFLKFTYAGDFSSVAANAQANFTITNLTPGATKINQLIHAFDSSFDVTKFKCDPEMLGAYTLVTCKRGIQNSYGWLAILDMGDKLPLGSCTSCMHVIGAYNTATNALTRWSGIHATYLYPEGVSLVLLAPHSMDQAGGPGAGPYYTTLTADVGTGDTTIHVAGEPLEDDVTEPYLMDAAVGDMLRIDSENLVITGKSGLAWTVTRGMDSSSPASHTSGVRVAMTAESVAGGVRLGARDVNWSFLDDPTGSALAIETQMWGGHGDFWSGGRVMEPYWGVIGPIVSRLNTAPDWNMTVAVAFAGAQSRGDGTTVSRYPSFEQYNAASSEKEWFADEPEFYGTWGLGAGATSISGQLYKYIFGDWGGLSRKQLATLAIAGLYTLTDISGPATGNVLGDTSGDSYKYCVAYAVNECRTGSAVNDVYVNIPAMDHMDCTGEGYATTGLCVANMVEANGAFQFGWTPNTAGKLNSDNATLGLGYSRKVTGSFSGVRTFGKIFKVLPDASWGFIDPHLGTLMVKIPPTPALDGVDRSTFVRAPISITTPQGLGIATATVEFGYAEQGTPTQYYCTSRRETCVAVASTVTDATPFQYKTTDTYSKASCAASCTITLPVLPLHVAYYQVKFYNGAGAFVQDGPLGVAMESVVR
jgi:hypothetical protein